MKNDRILNKVCNLLEMMTVGTGGFTSSADDSGPVAGFDPAMSFKRKKDGKVDRRSVKDLYKRWLNVNQGL